ncbi:hypothetical protein B0I35DRAFT_479320 [Stachybotrys elegans]|uniref:holo-[acyl-carrier-protein] synthase n=1 Tax=Stachybotrys elegans TaxID=80388 RepID=A0A8K0ST19_9HYPO|nr:hypothetical protein B0I35DRAFT_479320 [Stachybotrys elegans]
MSVDQASAACTGGDGSQTTVIQWVVDTRTLWTEAAQTKDLSRVASRALDLLTESEKGEVLRFYFVKDAKLKLVSILLKRYVISRFCEGVAWDEAKAVPDARTKPVFIMPDGSEPLLFNLTHQAGLVVLLAVHRPTPGLAVGVDLVCQPERRERDLRTITGQGWAHYVDMHDGMLSPGEMRALKALPFPDTDRRLAYFYSIWCLREAYVKMTGEALLAKWLRDLDMRGFAPPQEQAGKQLEIFLHGEKVQGVDMKLEPYLDEYMIGTAVRRDENGKGIELGEYVSLDIDAVLTAGEKSRRGES